MFNIDDPFIAIIKTSNSIYYLTSSMNVYSISQVNEYKKFDCRIVEGSEKEDVITIYKLENNKEM